MGRTWIVLLLALGLLAGACGGGGDDADDADTPTVDDTETGADNGAAGSGADDSGSDTDDSEPAEEAAPAAASGETRASVVLDGTTYEFGVTGQFAREACDPSSFGTFFGVTLPGIDGDGAMVPGVVLSAALLLPGVDEGTAGTPSFVDVTIDNGSRTWTSNSDATDAIPEGSAQVDDLTIDGATAQGSATFVDLDLARAIEPEIVTVQGTFTITCGDDL